MLSCHDKNNYVIKVNKSLKIDSTFVQAFRYSDKGIKIDTLCSDATTLRNDTLNIIIGDPFGFPVRLSIKYSNNKNYESFVKMWSDYDQYDGEHSKKIKIETEYLVLNKIKYGENDTILGEVKTKLTYINDKDFPFDSILFSGKFISIARL